MWPTPRRPCAGTRPGFAGQWEHRFEPGLPAFVEVARGEVRPFPSEHTGDARPDTLVEEACWARGIELRDPDGDRLRAGTPSG
ncbi:hypothetical protein GCM10010377_03380 [Streptomyces viridiviolaceus]|nr:hypothetical protein GCM10010377_03380 [Streptomyces viridiviolaceus]